MFQGKNVLYKRVPILGLNQNVSWDKWGQLRYAQWRESTKKIEESDE